MHLSVCLYICYTFLGPLLGSERWPEIRQREHILIIQFQLEIGIFPIEPNEDATVCNIKTYVCIYL